jgi:flavin reductase (DIM6/NTAB) family NADH-FMN oxidoreductase RutF
MISVGRKPDGSKKDTWVNIEERGDFVVHIPPGPMAKEMVATAATLPHGESEVTRLGLATVAEPGFRLPRLAGPKAAMFCERHQIVEVGDGPQGLILGEIKALFIDDAAGKWRDHRLIIDPKQVDPVARLGGEAYALLGDLLTIARPT